MARYPPYQTMTTLTPETSRPHEVHSTVSRRLANSSFRRTAWRPIMYSINSRISRPKARTTRMPENVSPTRPSMISASFRIDR
jgi:hypothetical protein